jgi:hypothetical protein
MSNVVISPLMRKALRDPVASEQIRQMTLSGKIQPIKVNLDGKTYVLSTTPPRIPRKRFSLTDFIFQVVLLSSVLSLIAFLIIL